jgi:hypothetical protein
MAAGAVFLTDTVNAEAGAAKAVIESVAEEGDSSTEILEGIVGLCCD